MLGKIGIVIALFGALIAGVDILLGARRLQRFEAWLVREILSLRYGDVYNSPVGWYLWYVIASPLLLFAALQLSRRGSTHFRFVTNRDRLARQIAAIDPLEYQLIYAFGSSAQLWTEVLGQKSLDLCLYIHCYPNPADDKVLLLGMPAPHEPSQFISRIAFFAPGVIEISTAPTQPKSEDVPRLALAYAEAAIEDRRIPHQGIEIPQNPLFTPLCDPQGIRAMSLARQLAPVLPRESAREEQPGKAVISNEPGTAKQHSSAYVLASAIIRWQLEVLVAHLRRGLSLCGSLAYEMIYLVLALVFNVACLFVVIPAFVTIYGLLLPFRASYWLADRLQLQSYVKVIGMALVIVGAILQIVA